MRQPTDKEKMKEMLKYYNKIKRDFLNGSLSSKMGILLASKAQELGISLRSWYRYKRGI